MSAQKEEIAFSTPLLIAHLFCIAVIHALNLAGVHGIRLLPSPADHLASSALLLAGIALLALACIPFRVWIRTFRATGFLWLLASFAGALAFVLRPISQSFWDASSVAQGRFLQVLTFDAVHAVLRIFLPDVMVDPASFAMGTERFAVTITEQCSGLEGLGLVLVFTVVWLWYFRKESRFPQALLLVPCALVCVWLLNIIRICVIILIGNAGAPDVAMVGFHSQAGWIAFTAVALGFSMATRKLSWVQRVPPVPSGLIAVSARAAGEERGESPATAAYLVPFLAILAASFVSRAASGYFEWLYPLRFLAAAFALWHYLPEYRKLNWRCGWLAPVAGVAVFLVWMAPEWWSKDHPANALGAALAGLSPAARTVWIAFRVAAAVVTVPIAEELAFRGYLLRRFMSRNFDTVPLSSLTMLATVLSSVAFGLMHGRNWMVGVLAGLAYAAVLRWRGRMGDAVVAHAVTNLLLAVWVLSRGDWAQW